MLPPDMTLSMGATLRDAISSIDRNSSGAALVLDETGLLLGIVTDGDIRRALLKGYPLEYPIEQVMVDRPITATRDFTREQLLHLVRTNRIAQVPIVDEDNRLVNIVLARDLLGEQQEGRRALIMAGGRGSRLEPLTRFTPKPMLKVGRKPIMETIIERLRDYGFSQIWISIGYMGEVIQDYFQDGSSWGVQIQYIREDVPLGTAGALGLFQQRLQDSLLVINGDILTGLNFRALADYHRMQDVDITVAVREYNHEIAFGVLKLARERVLSLQEKPVIHNFINAGIYMVSPAVVQSIHTGEVLDMTELINRNLDTGKRINSFPIHEFWADIGTMSEYLKFRDEGEEIMDLERQLTPRKENAEIEL